MAQGYDLNRLCAAMERSRLALRKFREERREAVRQLVGRHWSEEGAREKVPVNLLSLYCNIVGRTLIPKNPRVMLTTFAREHKATVGIMETWANEEIERQQLAGTLRRCVLDALFSIGVCKVALATPAEAVGYGWSVGPGAVHACRVDLDDFVYDIHARDLREAGFVGHRYRVPLDVVKDSKFYTKARKDLTASTDQPYNRQGDERISMLGRTYYGQGTDEYEDYVDLWEVYLPRQRVVLTLADDQLTGPAGPGGDEPLREQGWLGPEEGPYHYLAYGVVPGNAMPKAPLQDLLDLHDACNRIFRKLIRQAERQKEVLAVRAGATEDGSRALETNDGEAFRCDNPDKLQPIAFGGPNNQNFVLGSDLIQRFSWLAGNLDIMGGLSPQSKTATQDQMLNQNSTRALSDMQDSTLSFAADVSKALCWYWHHDPRKVMRADWSPRGLPQFSARQRSTPQQRLGVPFEQMQIRVDPYSLQHSTPQTRLAALNAVVQQTIIPLMPLLSQQGIAFDVSAYLQKVGKYLDMPDLGEIITLREQPGQGPESPDAQAPETPGMPVQTKRTYVRENQPGRTTQGDQMNLRNSLMGIDTGGASQGGQGMLRSKPPTMNGAY